MGVPAQAESEVPSTIHMLSNPLVEYYFIEQSNHLCLLYIEDKQTGLISNFADAAIWEIVTQDLSGAKTTHEPPTDLDLSVQVNPAGNSLTAVWTKVLGSATVLDSVTLVVNLENGSKRTDWDLSARTVNLDHTLVQLGLRLYLWDLADQSVGGMDAQDDVLALATNKAPGEKVRDPIGVGVDFSSRFPGHSRSMQFLALYDDGDPQNVGGLYLATEDPLQYRKSSVIRASQVSQSPSLEMSFRHLVEDHDPTLGDYQIPYSLTIEPYRGDWYHACLIYRDWVESSNVSWLDKGLVKNNPSIARWVKEAPYSVAVVSGEPQLGSPNDTTVETARHYRDEFFPTGTNPSLQPDLLPGVFWFQWQQVDINNTHERANPKPGFDSTFAQLHNDPTGKSSAVTLWMNGNQWHRFATITSTQYDPDPSTPQFEPWTQQDAELFAYQCEEGGSLKRLGPNDAATICPLGHTMYMYPGETLWKDLSVEVTDRIHQTSPIKGRHFDLFTADHTDYASYRGRTLGGGTYGYEDCRDFLDHVRAQLQVQEPVFATTVEASHEVFIGVTDIMSHNFFSGIPRTTYRGGIDPGGSFVPMWKVVYGPYQRVGGSNPFPLWHVDKGVIFPGHRSNDPCDDSVVPEYRQQLADNLLQAMGFVFGNILSRVELTFPINGQSARFIDAEVSPYEFDVANEFFGNLTGWTDFLLPYTKDGTMLREARVIAVDRTIDDDLDNCLMYGVLTSQTKAISTDMPYILNSVWKANDGSLGIVLVNWDDKDHQISWGIGGPDHGMPAPATYNALRFTDTSVAPVGSFTDNKFQRPNDTVPALSVVFYKLQPL